jgi:hypothetical protein
MDKWVISELTVEICEGDNGDPSTSASEHPTTENVSATTSATITTEELL